MSLNINNHAFNIEKLKVDFDNIITLKLEIAKTKAAVADNLNQLKGVYNDLLKSNSKKIFLFCLDSFYFQYKSFAMEMDNIDKFRSLLNNRMYCDYYKLYNIILSNIKDNKIEVSVEGLETKAYPPYKDLEPFQEYKLDDIKDIHANILLILNTLYNECNKKKDTIDNYNDNHRIGFSISNLINTLHYENNILKEQVSLYVNYVSFFHISQKKQLNRLFMRISDFCKEVKDNININRTFSIDDIEHEERLNRFFDIGQETEINKILEDYDFNGENTEKIIDKIDNVIRKNENIEVSYDNRINDNLNIIMEKLSTKSSGSSVSESSKNANGVISA
jgi:hypothetical protein